ncbi:MAG: hypothetical protein EOO30_13865 [Comamonadaceae bacterium]|nr:MAG: hypothetical protein EOO30_13865 [Comamonadaceae bacterium]
MTGTTLPLKILLHAPTAAAVARARSNAANLLKQPQSVEVRIAVNAEAVRAVLDTPDLAADGLTLVCPNTLARIGRAAPAPLTVLDEGAVLAIARMQAEGWRYIRA